MLDYFETVKDWELEYYFKYVLTNNPSNNLPYHNFYHTVCVLQFCRDAGETYMSGLDEIRALLIAALLHDFGHSGGKSTDNHNVQKAIDCVKKVLLPEDKHLETEIINIIKATEVLGIIDSKVVYVIPSEDLNISQKIIRDADLLQLIHHNFIQHTILGISAENSINIPELANNEIKFMENMKFLTERGNTEFNAHYRMYYDSVKYLADMFSDNPTFAKEYNKGEKTIVNRMREEVRQQNENNRDNYSC